MTKNTLIISLLITLFLPNSIFSQKRSIIEEKRINSLFCEKTVGFYDTLFVDVHSIFARSEYGYVICFNDSTSLIISKFTKKNEKKCKVYIKGITNPMDTIFYEITDTLLKLKNYYNKISLALSLYNFCIENSIFEISIRRYEEKRYFFEFQFFNVAYNPGNPDETYNKKLCDKWYISKK